ncbi:unnamed protein product [Amoebophrya sp. A120]|nr:unnamed protein product [Amoebophrya sp. A120]|eukprot:GSA120T00020845001.1
MPESSSSSSTRPLDKSESQPALVVTKDFSTNPNYWNKYVTPYVADRTEEYAFNPLHVPEKDNFDLKWRFVNKGPYMMKKYGRFPRPEKERTIGDIREEVGRIEEQKAMQPLVSPKSRAVFSPRGGESRTTSPGGTKKASNYENQKPGPEIFREKGDYQGLKNIDNFELAQMKLKEDTMYVPPGSKYQAPHPMSNTRKHFHDDATVDMKKVMALRKLGGAVIPTSKSLTNLPLATDKAATEFGSVKQLHKCRNKHMRSIHNPCERFSGKMMLGSQAVGWAQDDDRCARAVHYKGPTHGITDSFVTQYNFGCLFLFAFRMATNSNMRINAHAAQKKMANIFSTVKEHEKLSTC